MMFVAAAERVQNDLPLSWFVVVSRVIETIAPDKISNTIVSGESYWFVFC
jgi:hypothetical protein